MNTQYAALGLLLTSLMLTACSTSSHVVVGKTRPPVSPQTVQLYTVMPIGAEEVAILDATSRGSIAISSQGKVDKVIQRLKAEAAKLGANGIYLKGVSEQYAGAVTSGSAHATSYGTSTNAYGTGITTAVFHKVGSAVAIFVPPDSAADTRTYTLADHLRMLKQLLDEGIITQAEFDAQKTKLLNQE